MKAHRRGVRVAVLGTTLLCLLGASRAVGFWVSTDATHSGRAAAGYLPGMAAPVVVGQSGSDVSLSWDATTASTGDALTGYAVVRYPTATGGSPVAATGACAAPTAPSCTEAGVPSGTWYYAVAARLHAWTGQESARTGAVTIASSTFTIAAGQRVSTLPATVTGGSLDGFGPAEAVAFHLDTQAGQALAASVSAVDGAGSASGFTVTIPEGVVEGSHVIVAVGNAGSVATSNPFVVDLTAPVSGAAVAPTPNAAGWNSSTVLVTLSSSDPDVASITYEASGAETIGSTTVAGSSTSFSLTNEGTTTVAFAASDTAGNTETTNTKVVKIDTTAPSTTDDTASIGNAWQGSSQTVTLSPTDATSGVAATYYTTDGSTPTTASAQGTSVPLTGDGTHTVRYRSVDAAGNVEAAKTASTQIRIDKTAPSTTDDTASIGNGWKTASQTVTFTRTDATSGVVATYYTTDGSTPTTSSVQGSSAVLTADGVYTVKYFSVDAAGNAETVKTAGTQIRIDKTAPSLTVTTPTAGSYSSSTWSSIATNKLSGTSSDATSGVSKIEVSFLRSSTSRWWNGNFPGGGSGQFNQNAETWITVSGTTTWSQAWTYAKFPTTGSYVLKVRATDVAGNVTTSSSIALTIT